MKFFLYYTKYSIQPTSNKLDLKPISLTMTHPTVFRNKKYLFAVFEPEHQKCFVPNRRFFLSDQANNKIHGQFIQSNWIKKEIFPDQELKMMIVETAPGHSIGEVTDMLNGNNIASFSRVIVFTISASDMPGIVNNMESDTLDYTIKTDSAELTIKIINYDSRYYITLPSMTVNV